MLTLPLGPGTATTPWPEAERRLRDAELFWLGTSNRAGDPHVRPVLAVWHDGHLHFACGPGTVKGGNLRHRRRCTLTTAHDRLHLVVEGVAERVLDLAPVARVYAEKWGWHVKIRDGAFWAEGAPTAGPPPYHVFRLRPRVVYGFPEDGTLAPTRWRF